MRQISGIEQALSMSPEVVMRIGGRSVHGSNFCEGGEPVGFYK